MSDQEIDREWSDEFEAMVREKMAPILGPPEKPAVPPRTSRAARLAQHERANERILGKLSASERVHRYCMESAIGTRGGPFASNPRIIKSATKLLGQVDHEMRGAPDPVWWQEAMEDLADGVGEQLPPDAYCEPRKPEDALDGCHATPEQLIADMERRRLGRAQSWKTKRGIKSLT